MKTQNPTPQEIKQLVSFLPRLRKGTKLRIDCPGTFAPAKPIDLIDLTTGNLRILRPHNGTWMEVPAERLKPRQESSIPTPTIFPDIGAHPTHPGTPGTLPTLPETPIRAHQQDAGFAGPTNAPQLPPGIGPQPREPPVGPTRIPAIPAGPRIPGPSGSGGPLLPPGIRPGSGLPQGIVAGMPPMMNSSGAPPALTPATETRTIHGYFCKQYTLSIPHTGVMTLWLSDSTDLPPFHLLKAEAPPLCGPTEWRQQWPALVRKGNFFPMLAILRASPERDESEEGDGTVTPLPANLQGRELIRWEISAISPISIEDQEDDLFSVPATFLETKLSPF